MAKRIYVRTDKNGTKIYHDYTCTRCGGLGYSEAWRWTGMTCYKCGGTGVQAEPQIVKEYTPEYAAKLAEQRRKRQEKERVKRLEALKTQLPEMLVEKGFSADGKMYVATGDTYSMRDQLRAAGAHWKSYLKGWVFTEDHPEFNTVAVNWDEVMTLNTDGGYLEWKPVMFEDIIKDRLPKVEKPVSEYLGEVGKRLEVEATLTDIFQWETQTKTPWGGYEEITKTCYKFVDQAGNILVWITSGYGIDAEKYPKGSVVTLRGTVNKQCYSG